MPKVKKTGGDTPVPPNAFGRGRKSCFSSTLSNHREK
jgi:hypothetical protein